MTWQSTNRPSKMGPDGARSSSQESPVRHQSTDDAIIPDNQRPETLTGSALLIYTTVATDRKGRHRSLALPLERKGCELNR